MCVKLSFGDLNPSPWLRHPTSTYTCGVTTAHLLVIKTSTQLGVKWALRIQFDYITHFEKKTSSQGRHLPLLDLHWICSDDYYNNEGEIFNSQRLTVNVNSLKNQYKIETPYFTTISNWPHNNFQINVEHLLLWSNHR